MELRRDFILGIGVLVAFNILISFGVIGLLVRMGPAIDLILQENVYSIQAAEQVLSVLATDAEPAVSAAGRRTFDRWLKRIKSNVTEEDESVAIAAIERVRGAALEGDRQAVRSAVRALLHLTEINRRAMHEANLEAQRLGGAGAWAAVFFGFIGFLVGMLVTRRFNRRILLPLEELYLTVEAARGGDRYRRCSVPESPNEIKRILLSVNALLDRAASTAE